MDAVPAGVHMHSERKVSGWGSTMQTRWPDASPCAAKYLMTRSPYAECTSGARTRSEHERGRPPPKMSSREGMPVDVIVVAGDPGHGRVPGGWGGCFDVIRLLNADMKTFRAVEWMGASQGLERQCRLARPVWRRVQA